MRRAALALLLLVAAAAAALAAAPDALSARAVEFQRELRRQAVTRTLSNADLRSRLDALKAEHSKNPDPKVAKSLEAAEANLKRLLDGQPLAPPEEGEAEPAARPEPLAPERPPLPSPVLENVHAIAAPESAAAYFDRAKTRLGAPAVAVPDKQTAADLSGYLALTGDAAQQAHLLEKSAKLVAALSLGDATGARASSLAARLHQRLTSHALRPKFATVQLRAVAGRLRLAYVLKDGTAGEEDLGTIAEWTTPFTGGGGSYGGGSAKGGKGADAPKAPKSAKSGGGSRKGGAAKRGAKGGGGSGGGGKGDADSAAAAGKGGRGQRDGGGASSDSAKVGRGDKGAGLVGGVASLGRPRANAGKGMSSGEGAPGSRRATVVPLPKGFDSRSVRDSAAGGAAKGTGAAGTGAKGGGAKGPGAKGPSAKGDVAGAPPKVKAGKGSLPDGVAGPAVGKKAGPADGPQATGVAESGPVPHPASMTGDDELHDAVAAHEARLPASMAVPLRSAGAGGEEEPAPTGVTWEALLAALGATAIAVALLQAHRDERPLVS